MLRVLRVARRSAMKARTQAANQLDSLLVTAPDQLRAQFRGLAPGRLVKIAAALRPGEFASPIAATKLALRELARRHQALTGELDRLDSQVAKLAPKAAPPLLARRGVGPQTAAALLVAAGDNPDRLRSEAASSMLCGASPVEASSGKTVRHRLNRGGDRQANNALWVIALARMASDQPTKDYVERRTKQGKSKKDIIRCLKRYIAREVYQDLQAAIAT
jgi:transposase